jgi:hypothetical protein
MAVNCGPSFGICALRVTLLDDFGNTNTGTDNSYVTDKQVSIAFSPNIDTGNTFSLRNGCGCSLARFKSEDVFNWWEFTFTDGALEPELTTLMVGGTTIADGADVVGQHFPGNLACDEIRRQVGLEFWTQHIVGSGKDATFPYVHWVFPMSVWQWSDNTAEEDFMNPVLTGFSRSNELWGGGPYGDGPPDGSDVGPEGAYWKSNDLPPAADCAAVHVAPGS